MNVSDFTERLPQEVDDGSWAWAAGRAADDVARDILGRVHPDLGPVSGRVVGASIRDGWLALDLANITVVVGPPAGSSELPEEWSQLDWELPPELQRVYAVAGGLGPVEEGAWLWRDALLPPDRLAPLLSRMRFGEEDILYDPTDLLVISTDGRGGAWCLRRDEPGWPVVHWDHTTHALSRSQGLAHWLGSLGQRW